MWFTDPNYGEIQGFKGAPEVVPEVVTYVYRHGPATGETAVVADSFNKPLGLKDERPAKRTSELAHSPGHLTPEWQDGRPNVSPRRKWSAMD